MVLSFAARAVRTLLLASAASLPLAGTAMAGPAWEFTSASNSFSNGTWVFATSFLVNDTVTASGLGYYADPTTGNVSGNPVALYECSNLTCTGTGTLLASALIDNTYDIVGHFRYQTITPVTLEAGRAYQVSGVSNETNYTWNNVDFTTDPALTILTADNGNMDRYAQNITDPIFLNSYFNNGNGAEVADGWWGPNVFLGDAAGFTDIPEPGTLALLGMGLLGIAGLRRRR